MSSSFQRLFPLLKDFERHHLKLIQATVGTPPCPAAHGSVQFVSIEPGEQTGRAKTKSAEDEFTDGDEKELPVIVGVGINYWQNPNGPTATLTPCLPTVIDFDSEMRRAVNDAMGAYRRNSVAWTTPFNKRDAHASHVPHLPEGSDYILIATNFCPFITLKLWGKHEPKEQTDLLKAWSPPTHLDALFRLIGADVDLWIGHGVEHWSKFDAWRVTWPVHNWMVTYNLSGLGSANMAKARSTGNDLYK